MFIAFDDPSFVIGTQYRRRSKHSEKIVLEFQRKTKKIKRKKTKRNERRVQVFLFDIAVTPHVLSLNLVRNITPLVFFF